MQELVRRGVDSHDIDVAMREAFGPDTQKLHIHSNSAADDGDAEAAGRFSKFPALAACRRCWDPV